VYAQAAQTRTGLSAVRTFSPLGVKTVVARMTSRFCLKFIFWDELG
jgi:hypothetical protein